MRNTSSHHIWFISVTAAALTLGCSATNPAADDRDDESDRDTAGPLAEYMSHSPVAAGFGGNRFGAEHEPAGHSAEEILRRRQIEELTAECMREEGFEYVPVTLADHARPADFEEAYSLPPEQFAAQYGYGLTTLDYVWEAENADREDDPNARIRDGLSATAREAYDHALWGRPDSDSGHSGGCHGQSDDDAGPSDDGLNLDDISREFDQLFNDVDALFERVRQDPRVSAAVEEWRTCMAERGHPGFEDLDQPFWSIHEQANRARIPAHEAEEAPGAVTGVVIEGDTRFVIPADDLARLKEQEIDLATADLACRDEHQSTYHRAALDLEREFVEAHRAELEQYREATAGR